MKTKISFCRYYEYLGTGHLDVVYNSGTVRTFDNPSDLPETVQKYYDTAPYSISQFDKLYGREVIYSHNPVS